MTFSPIFVLAGLEFQRSPAYTCMTAKGFVPYCDESAEPPLREYITYAKSKVSGCLQADDMNVCQSFTKLGFRFCVVAGA